MRLGRRSVVAVAVAGGLAAGGCTEAAPELDPASVFEGVEGYAFPSLPPTVERSVVDSYRANPELADRVTAVEIRTVQEQGGEAVAVAMVLAVDPEVAADPGFERGVVGGFSADAGSPLQRVELGGRTAFEGTPIGALGGTHVVLWREANLVVVLWGTRPADDRAAAEAMLQR